MKYVQDAAQSFLFAHNFDRLPIDLTNLDGCEGITSIGPYSAWVDLIENYGCEGYVQSRDGFTLATPIGTYILYRDSLSFAERNWVIAHEIGHVQLKHTAFGSIIGFSDDPATHDQQEIEANRFAEALLAPVPVLARMRVRTPYDIQSLTGLPLDRARAVFADVLIERATGEHVTGRRLSKQFRCCIREQRWPTSRRNIARIAVLLIAAVLLAGYCVTTIHRRKTTVAVTGTGERYHRTSCFYAQNRAVTLLSIDKAQSKGYEPCKICEP